MRYLRWKRKHGRYYRRIEERSSRLAQRHRRAYRAKFRY
jgi:hypothetical protein